MLDLYVNYDCDVACTNLFEELCRSLCRNAVPETGPLTTLHVLSLEGILAVVENMARRCISAKSTHHDTAEDAQTPASDDDDDSEFAPLPGVCCVCVCVFGPVYLKRCKRHKRQGVQGPGRVAVGRPCHRIVLPSLLPPLLRSAVSLRSGVGSRCELMPPLWVCGCGRWLCCCVTEGAADRGWIAASRERTAEVLRARKALKRNSDCSLPRLTLEAWRGSCASVTR
jgi:hypothetical protein